MSPFADLKDKTRPIFILCIILLIILLNNLSGRKDYANLDKNISSIYADRLMPSNYLFRINDHLYQKRLLRHEHDQTTDETTTLLAAHNTNIDKLIKEYEATYLTKTEKEHWLNFKQNIVAYNKNELKEYSTINNELLNKSFDNCMLALQQLNTIQATEGKQLQVSSRAILGGSLIGSYLEISLLFILAIIFFVLLSKPYISNKSPQLFPVAKDHLYN